MDIATIIQLVLTLIEKCKKKDGKAAVYKRLRHPGVRERAALRSRLARDGLQGRELREAVDMAMSRLRNASAAEIRELLNKAESEE